MDTPIDIGTRRELLVDHHLIAELRNLSLLLQRPRLCEPAMVCDAPWEDDLVGFNSVFQDGEKVRLYYRASIPDRANEDLVVLAMAESRDRGLGFERPDLGLVEFAGSKANNILAICEPPFVPPPAFLDTNPACKPEERYKGLGCRWQKLYAMVSADGLRWRPLSTEPLVMQGTFDTVNTAFWDARNGCYRCYTRYFENLVPGADLLGPRPTAVRAIQSSTSEDFVRWTPVVPNQYEDGYDAMQLYTNSVLPCPGAEHLYLAFPNRYVQERTADPGHPHPGVNDALFMSSRDGVHWTRHLEAWVRPGLDPLNWTERNNYPTWGLVETSATEWSLYISEHYRHPGTPVRHRRLAVRPYGFVSLHAEYRGGECLTRPLVFGGRSLHLNYSTSAAGSIRVEIQAPGGTPVPGFGLEDMEPMYGDALDQAVQWHGGGDLSSLAGRPARLRFALSDADLFAFRAV
jgi:hypothetical protein